MIAEFNKWYDSLPEPQRFLTAMGLIMAGLIPLSIPSPLSFFGALWLGVLLYIRIKGRLNART